MAAKVAAEPLHVYTGRTEYLITWKQAEQRLAQVRARLARPVVGFDTEWRVILQKRLPPSGRGLGSQPAPELNCPTALVQLAFDLVDGAEDTDENEAGGGDQRAAPLVSRPETDKAACGSRRTVLLIHLSRIGGMPTALRSILEDAGIIKVGFLTHNDTAKLEPEYAVTTRNLADLADVAGRCRAEWALERFSLDRLCRRVLGRGLAKHAQLSDWERPLSPAQCTYAATDASVVLELWDALQVLHPLPGVDTLARLPGVEQVLRAREEARISELTAAYTTYKLFQVDGLAVDDIAHLRHVKTGTVLEHLCDVYATGASLRLDRLPLRLSARLVDIAEAVYEDLVLQETPRAPAWTSLRNAINARYGQPLSFEHVKLAVAAVLHRQHQR